MSRGMYKARFLERQDVTPRWSKPRRSWGQLVLLSLGVAMTTGIALLIAAWLL